MSQKKNSESARANAVKRELSIAIRVLENKLATGELPRALEQSLKVTIEYLKGLREEL